jgi:hypothetical protein
MVDVAESIVMVYPAKLAQLDLLAAVEVIRKQLQPLEQVVQVMQAEMLWLEMVRVVAAVLAEVVELLVEHREAVALASLPT